MLATLLGLPQFILLLVLIVVSLSGDNRLGLEERYGLNTALITKFFNPVLLVWFVLWLAGFLLPLAVFIGWANLVLDVIAILWFVEAFRSGKLQVLFSDIKAKVLSFIK